MGILTPLKMRGVLAFALLVLLVLRVTPAHADDAAQPLKLYEEKIKAGLVYNFLKYTNWSADILTQSNNSLLVCLFGNDSFDSYLYPLEGRSAQQYVIKIAHVTNVSETRNCNAILIHRNRENILPALLESLKGKNVLTISDIDQFTQEGGMVELNMQHHRIGFFINKNALDQAGLTIQNRLLKLAKQDSDRNG
jgi:hypothetical protein